MPMTTFLCPVCKTPLCEIDKCAVCSHAHVFDRAKEGYFYLLNPQDKNSKDPGDNKDMVRARRDFLDGDFYLPLASEIAKEITERFPEKITLLDAGVGTGYYLNALARARGNDKDVYFGVDVSKHAVKIAAKRNKAAHIAVASVFDLPFADKSFDVVTCVFSPYAMQEYSRVLKDGGLLILAYPYGNHLLELRQALYENVRDNTTSLPPCSDFEFALEKELTYTVTARGNQIDNLLTMTPYVYRAPKDSVEKVRAKTELSLTCDFHISVLKKISHIDK